jgi:signal transduction histidine kinase
MAPTVINEAFYVYLVSVALAVIVTGTVIGVVIVIQRRQVEQSRRFSQGLVKAQEAERARIARELHDDIMQRVALIGGELSGLGRTVPNPPEAFAHRIEGLREELQDLADEVRGLARRTHPTILDHLGLVRAVQNLAGEMKISDNLEVTVSFPSGETIENLSPEAALALYRVAQEGLRNVARYAGVGQALVTLGMKGPMVYLQIDDRGKGITSGVGGGLGLPGLAERLRAVEGHLSINSEPGKGTRLTASVYRRGMLE